MVSAELEYADRRMKQKWYELVQAEQRGASQQVLERMFNAYMLSVEEYNRLFAADQQGQQMESEVAERAQTWRSAQKMSHPRRKPRAS